MERDSAEKFKTPALGKKQEINSSMTQQRPESEKDSRPRKRKANNSPEDETPRKLLRVSEVAGSSTSCQDQIRTLRRAKRNMPEKGEGLSPPAKKKKKGLLELVLTKEPPSSSVDVSKECSSSILPHHCAETRNLRKRKAKDFEEPPARKRVKRTETKKERADAQRAKFREQYMELQELGEGGFGSVFAGYRVEDNLPVAIKHIPKDKVILKHKDENGRQLAMEVAIMLKLNAVATSSGGQSPIVSLLDWYDVDQELIIVMERPMPSDNLFDYISDHKGPIKESKAKLILKQLVEAGIYLQDASIFHSDIKPENILIETSSEVPRVVLIDFGLSCFDKRRKFEIFRGTTDHIPPEFDRNGSYSAGPTTVWQLGVVLFEILHKKMFKTPSFLMNKLKIGKRLSKKCKDFLNKCLTEVPEERPTLEELLCHPWFL
ncbi:serine/threonine-protein kinase pim-1-like isoform X2 [Fundulus heteroclitus]|uniref:serine/threonine-protein kinase pim-1-like isoform X2 n=1 Tax=Fundulus heteroclitus TaxID=8078 RepID=UPI00165CA175|nr:serine/threonine-protein kinase pim-1-like isoform X2 [Fundulus heteroclitus]